MLGGAENSIHGTGLNALGAADTFVLADKGHTFYIQVFTVFGVQAGGFYIEQICQSINGCLAAGWAFVNSFAIGDGLGIGAAAGVTTLTTLGLWQQGVDLFNNRVAFHFEFNRS